jgi:post-segregation antitoxin (ccd killing protein)
MRRSNLTVAFNFFADGRAIDVVGASGALDYDSATEETQGAVEVWTVFENGECLACEMRFDDEAGLTDTCPAVSEPPCEDDPGDL